MNSKDEKQELARAREAARNVPAVESPPQAAAPIPNASISAEEMAKAESFVEVASVDEAVIAEVVAQAEADDDPNGVRKLQAEIAELRAQLVSSENARTEAQQAALESAQAQGMLMQREIEEVPTGRSVTVRRLNPAKPYKVVDHHDDGRDILRPLFVDVKLPTYFYKIDLAPQGGMNMTINGVKIYHGAVVELDIDTLRSVKEIVYRGWKHDSDTHKSDENVYRKDRSWQQRNRGIQT